MPSHRQSKGDFLQPWYLRYGVAILAILAAFGIRYSLVPLIGEDILLIIFVPAIMIAGWYGGLGPAILAAAVGLLLANYFFMSPQGAWTFNVISLVGSLSYISAAWVVIALTNALKQAESRAKETAARSRQAEARERESAQKLQLVLDNIPAVVFMKNFKGVNFFANRSFERLMKCPRNEIEGKTDFELFPKEIAENFSEHDRRVLELGKTLQVEGTVEAPDGPHTFLTAKVPLRDSQGKIYAICGIATDITRRKRHEEALRLSQERLRRSEAEFRQMFELAVVGMVQLSLSRHFLRVNQKFCDITGYSPEELLQMTSEDLTHPDDRAEDAEKFRRFSRGEVPAYFATKRYVRKDGKIIWAQVSASFIRDSEGKRQYTVGIIEDITPQKEAEEKLWQLNEQLEERVTERTAKLEASLKSMESFCYTIAHDLRSPLRAMRGFTEVLKDEYKEKLDEAGKEYCTRIVAASGRMDQLISDLLEYGRLTHLQLPTSMVSLTDEIEKVLHHFDTEIRKRKAEVTIDKPLPPVCADGPVLDQILENLISNALKFVSPEIQPKIHLYSEQRQDKVRLWVEDNGIGIAPEHYDRIFGPFQRLHTDEEYPGTGIGLAIVQKGIEQMGGAVGVESQPGKGSRFWIELPDKSHCVNASL